MPIPGANDGGSGTAVLLDLLGWVSRGGFTRDIAVAFLDAEDLGNIEGRPFSIGASYLANHPVPGFDPEEVLVLDMIGGKGMVLDIDANSLAHAPSLKLTREVFRIGASMGYSPFSADKPDRVKSIICDHYPFLMRGRAACLLIDIDYPQWHTQDDTPEALGAESLGIISAAVSLFLSRFQG
jgi:Zn-dependent M28 family amino/carboxypeptidase